ncbi:thioredoxin reductase [Teratosphaeria destructans]|uniref:Thioredoxin reductase n=1 Tax=Teratosphaeria destructans TaxID=418781 RepID=A0A9W7SUS1_9PEZI|nr:thioredoxin reductase [Teratosphaeria destructans]
MLASDKTKLPPRHSGRGDGYFANDDPPAIVPCAIVLLEAALRLYARDRRKRIGSCAMRLICYVEEYVDRDGYLGERRLPSPLQRFYEELKDGEKPVRQWTMELEDALGVQHDGAGDQAAPFGERG